LNKKVCTYKLCKQLRFVNFMSIFSKKLIPKNKRCCGGAEESTFPNAKIGSGIHPVPYPMATGVKR
jgi:hypothetical protein